MSLIKLLVRASARSSNKQWSQWTMVPYLSAPSLQFPRSCRLFLPQLLCWLSHRCLRFGAKPSQPQSVKRVQQRRRRSATGSKSGSHACPLDRSRWPSCKRSLYHSHPLCSLKGGWTHVTQGRGKATCTGQSGHALLAQHFLTITSPLSTLSGTFPTRHFCRDSYFMALAYLTAQRSKDPNRQVREQLRGNA